MPLDPKAVQRRASCVALLPAWLFARCSDSRETTVDRSPSRATHDVSFQSLNAQALPIRFSGRFAAARGIVQASDGTLPTQLVLLILERPKLVELLLG